MKKYIFPLIVFILLTFILTYPLIFNIISYIPGFFSTDEPFGVLWESWRIKTSISEHLSVKHSSLIAYPFGMDFYSAGFMAYLWIGLFYFLSIFTTPVLTYNLVVLFNFILCGLCAYILVYYFTKDKTAAILSGIIFAFCPYQFVRSWQHLGLTFNEWIPLCLFAVIFLKDAFSKKSAVIFLLSFLILFSFDWSIMLLTCISLAAFFIYTIMYNWRSKIKEKKLILNDFIYFKGVFLLGLVVISILLIQFIPTIIKSLKLSSATASVFNPYHRPFEDLFAQSARPLSYLLPATSHPVFGKFTEQFIGSSLYGISLTEHTLYLGWVPLVLAFIAARRWRKRRREAKLGTVPFGDSPYIGFFIFLAVVAWLFSQPPWWKIGPVKVFMPSYFMYKVLPMYRAYCRFGIVLMLAVAVLAGFGLKFILERFKSQKVKVAITILFCGLVLFEFWNYPPFKVIDVSRAPLVYYWLKEQPADTVIAEYPLDAESANELYKFYQTKHEKKMINGAIPGTYAHKFAQTITKLSEPHTAGILKWMGVKYVLVHKNDYLETEQVEIIEDLNKIPDNKGLKLIKSFSAQDCPRKDITCVRKTGPIDVYEVIAPPIEPVVKD